MHQEKIENTTGIKKTSLLTVLVLSCLYISLVNASQYSELCEEVANGDMSNIYILKIHAPADAQIDINNDGVIDSVSCRRSSLSLQCYFDDKRSGEFIGTVTESGIGKDDYYYEDIIHYNNSNYVLTRVGTEQFNSPSIIMQFTQHEKRAICEFTGAWDEDAVKWNDKYQPLKKAFNTTLPAGAAAPDGAPIEIVTFERPASIEPTFGGGYNVVKNYDYIDFDNDGNNEYVAEEIQVPALDSACNNTHLVEVDRYGKQDYSKSDILYKLWDAVGQCGNPTFYFYFNDQFFIKTDNAILTIHGENLEIVAQRQKMFKVEKISYPSVDNRTMQVR